MNRREMDRIGDPFEGRVIDAEEVVARGETGLDALQSVGTPREEPCMRYRRLQTVLGEGTFKIVYKAIDQEEGKEVAWNEIKMGERCDARERAAFANEIALLKSISHPNILKIFDYWFSAESFIFITELMTGGTLREYVSQIGDLNVRLIKRWGRQVLEGLVYLHAQSPPIIHRDIKCENIFVNATLGEVKIGDLGVAKERRMKRYTVVGTPQFMAREMFEGDGYCEKIDVYAFGMCLIEMATGMYPYKECLTAAEVYKAIIQGVPPVVLNSIKDVCLRNLIMNCLVAEKDRLSSVDCLGHHFFDSESTCSGECIPAECMAATPLTAPANDMEISLLGFRDHVITFQLFFMSMARFIKFDFDLQSDTVEEVANEMLEEEVVSGDQRDSLLKLLARGIEKAKEGMDDVQRGVEKLDLEKGVRNDFNKIAGGCEDAESTQEVSDVQGVSPGKARLLQSPEISEEDQKRLAASRFFDDVECPSKKYDSDVLIEEFSIDVSVATKRSPEIAGNWIKTFKSNDIDTVFELKVLVDEDWDKLGLTVFSSRAMKNMLYGLDKIPLKEKQLPTNMLMKEYEGTTEIRAFLGEIAVLVGKEKCVSGWESKLLAQDIRTVEELRSLHQDDWDRLGLSVYSCRLVKNVIFRKGRM